MWFWFTSFFPVENSGQRPSCFFGFCLEKKGRGWSWSIDAHFFILPSLITLSFSFFQFLWAWLWARPWLSKAPSAVRSTPSGGGMSTPRDFSPIGQTLSALLLPFWKEKRKRHSFAKKKGLPLYFTCYFSLSRGIIRREEIVKESLTRRPYSSRFLSTTTTRLAFCCVHHDMGHDHFQTQAKPVGISS